MVRLRLIAKVQKMATLALSRFEDVKAALDETLHLDHLRDEVESDSCQAFYFLGGHAFLTVTVKGGGPVFFTEYYGQFGGSISSRKKVDLEMVLNSKWLEAYGEKLQEFIQWSKEHHEFRQEVLEKVKTQGEGSLNADEKDTYYSILADQEDSTISNEFSDADKKMLQDYGIRARKR